MSLPVGFFAPLPLPMMIAFMGIQSAVMAEQFGTNFQYGKRRISAMSNEEFNALTPEIMQAQFTAQLKGLVPEMEKQIQSMRPLATAVLAEFGEYLRAAIDAINPLTSGPQGETSLDALAHVFGTHIGHEGTGGTTGGGGQQFEVPLEEDIRVGDQPLEPTPPESAQLKNLYYTYPVYASWTSDSRRNEVDELKYWFAVSHENLIDIIKVKIVSRTQIGDPAPHTRLEAVIWYTNKTITQSYLGKSLPTSTVHPSGYNVVHPR